jgi:hypothetical protein
LAAKGIVEVKEEFSEEMAERCAWSYKRKHRKATTMSGAECLPKGWTWSAVDSKLENGLPNFLAERGIVKEKFSKGMAERCARAYKRKHGKPPSAGSGTECLPEGWTWGAIDGRLNGLSKFLAERGIGKEKFSKEMVERRARVYKGKHGKAPVILSGAECLPEGWTWSAIDQRLDGLSKFLAERGIAKAKEKFSESMAERCARAYKGKYGKAPTTNSGTEYLPEGWTWAAISQRLENGLLRFLTERGVAKEEYSEEMAERCARVYKRKHGKAPSQESGGECLSELWTWGAIDGRLRRSGSSLLRFLTERGIHTENFHPITNAS